jgi:hypothetical protein
MKIILNILTLIAASNLRSRRTDFLGIKINSCRSFGEKILKISLAEEADDM